MQISNISATETSEVNPPNTVVATAFWANPDFIKVDDTNCADGTQSGSISDLKWRVTGFSIPSNAIITGVEVILQGGPFLDVTCQFVMTIRDTSGVEHDYPSTSSYNKTLYGSCAIHDSQQTSIGGQYDKWNVNWVVADFNSPPATWNVKLRKSDGNRMLINYARLIVYYVIPSADIIPEKIVCQIARGGNGYIEVTLPDENLANLTALKSYIKKAIAVYDNNGEYLLGGFEFLRLEPTFNEVTYHGTEYLRKALKCRVDYNPILLIGILDAVSNEYIHDADEILDNGRFGVSIQNKHISFQQNAPNSLIFAPNSSSGIVDSAGSPFSPDSEFGDYLYIQRHYTKDNTEYWWGEEDKTGENHWNAQIYFRVLVKDPNTAPDSIEFVCNIETEPIGEHKVGADMPRFKIYNYDSSTWEDWKVLDVSEYGNQTGPFDISIIKTTNISDYLSAKVDTVNGFNRYDLRIRYDVGEIAGVFGGSTDTSFKIFVARLICHYDDPQLLEKAEGFTGVLDFSDRRIELINDANYDHADQMGICEEDSYVIGTNMKTVIDTAWSNHALNNKLTLSFDSTVIGADYIDRTYDNLYSLLDDYNKSLDRDFWMNNQWVAKCTDSYVSTGLTITEDDIVGAQKAGSWKYIINAENLYDEIIVIGQYKTAIGSKTGITNEFDTIENIVINDVRVLSAEAAKNKAESLQYLHTNAKRILIFTLDMNKAGENYWSIYTMKEISVNFFSGVIQHTDMLIDSITWQQERAGQLFATLVCIVREHA